MLYSVEVGLGVSDTIVVEVAYSQSMPIREHLMQLGLSSVHFANQSFLRPRVYLLKSNCFMPTLILRFLHAAHPALDF
jgi:hypothetical protein